MAPGKKGPADSVYVPNDTEFSPCRNEKMRVLGRTPFQLSVALVFRVLHT